MLLKCTQNIKAHQNVLKIDSNYTLIYRTSRTHMYACMHTLTASTHVGGSQGAKVIYSIG